MGNRESPEAAKPPCPELAELRQAVDRLQPDVRAIVDPPLERIERKMGIQREALRLIKDALVQFRLDMKYLMFDVETTRRERDTAQERVRELEGRG